jgi:GDP-4-dehydro-6-deoxy-D-mannose reductase
MRALVIGADGFAGRWLLRHLRDSGDDVTALTGPNFRPPLDAADTALQVDIVDGPALRRAVADARPDVVFDLAGVSQAGTRDEPSAAIGVTVVGGMNALLACALVSPSPRLLFVSTGYVYRGGPAPLDEASPTDARAVYATAKLTAERALATLSPAVGVDVIVVRPFNHVGPGQHRSFLLPSLARQVAEAARGAGEPIVQVADASVVRDFSDVRDVATAYRLLAEHGEAGSIYNVASGRGIAVSEAARLLGEVAGVRVEVRETGNGRVDEEPILIGDAGRLEALGWRRRFTLEQTLKDVMDEALAAAAA